MKLRNIILKEESIGSKLVPFINNAIDRVDTNLSYKDFAEAIAIIIKQDYGSHNIEPFMEELHMKLGINESK